MKRCDCYNARVETIESKYGSFIDAYGVCLGTKEQNRCNCYGDESKCDFYPEKRKAAEKKMNTAEMWLKAQEDGKIYECINGDIAYSKAMGLVDKDDFNEVWELSNWDDDKAKALDNLLGGCEWREMPIKIMTKHEAAVEFGIRIVG